VVAVAHGLPPPLAAAIAAFDDSLYAPAALVIDETDDAAGCSLGA